MNVGSVCPICSITYLEPIETVQALASRLRETQIKPELDVFDSGMAQLAHAQPGAPGRHGAGWQGVLIGMARAE